MSSTVRFRSILRDLRFIRLWNAWTRDHFVNKVVKRCRKELATREVWQRFRQTVFRPRRTILLSVTAAYRGRDDDLPSCDNDITDEEMQALIANVDDIDELSKMTLYCPGCQKRAVIDKKQPGVVYCQCTGASAPEGSEDGWEPYMEAEDVIIWRKEYKPSQGLYAYKVYGRYKEVSAKTFAAIQIDGVYRRVWDNAVAAMSIVEREANGIKGQAVLHWEVLWPRLFANRDYVYIRRHREFSVKSKCLSHKDSLFESSTQDTCKYENNSANVKQTKDDGCEDDPEGETLSDVAGEEPVPLKDNKVYVIVSKSCQHENVPETKNAIRVTEYWSHMVVRSLDGDEKPGMEFVLTYYDEPAVGGLPAGVAAWATGRAAPAYLYRMRAAANKYEQWLRTTQRQLEPDFTPFGPEKLSHKEKERLRRREQDMESSKQGPELNGDTQDQATQTDTQNGSKVQIVKMDKAVDTREPSATKKDSSTSDGDGEKCDEEDNGGWWRYLYPFYYFV